MQFLTTTYTRIDLVIALVQVLVPHGKVFSIIIDGKVVRTSLHNKWWTNLS